MNLWEAVEKLKKREANEFYPVWVGKKVEGVTICCLGISDHLTIFKDGKASDFVPCFWHFEADWLSVEKEEKDLTEEDNLAHVRRNGDLVKVNGVLYRITDQNEEEITAVRICPYCEEEIE